MRNKFLLGGLFALLLPCLAGCSSDLDETKIKSVTFSSYYFDKIETEELNFDSNEYIYSKKKGFRIGAYENGKEVCSSFASTFDEKKEKDFFSQFRKTNVLELEEIYGDVYEDPQWSFKIEFKDGSSFSSKAYGYDRSLDSLDRKETKIFNKLGKCYYDLVGDYTLLGHNAKLNSRPIEKYDIRPLFYDDKGDECYIPVQCGNYFWNKEKKDDVDLYELNFKHKNNSCFENSETEVYFCFDSYLMFQDLNYDPVEWRITSYDFCKELTNKKIEYDWKSTAKDLTELSKDTYSRDFKMLELNKIYTIDYIYGSGDYYQYTFNTYISDNKMPVGRYYPSYDHPFGYLDIKEDKTFIYHFNNHMKAYTNETVEEFELKGTYNFETVNSKEKLILRGEDNSIIAYDFDCPYLIGDDENSSFDKTDIATVLFRPNDFSEDATLKYRPIEVQ